VIHVSRRMLAMVGAGVLAAGVGPLATAAGARPADRPQVRHVMLLSVDGLHQSDVAYYAARYPRSALAALVAGGVEYTHAETTFPSDSFPGMVAQATGAGPGTTGVYYDDTWNHRLLPAGTVNCAAATPGAEVSYTEAADRSQNPISLDAGQQLNAPVLRHLPTNTVDQTLADAPALTGAILQMTPKPQALLNPGALPVGPVTCQPVYPHSYLRVNTIFEAARAHGLRTAWSDKHPAYEILNGPSGTGVQDLFTPEINSVADGAGDDWTKNNLLTREYDNTKVAAVLNEIDGKDHAGSRHLGTPAIFGVNFQTVSTAEKLPTSNGLAGGYLPSGVPGPLLSSALDYIDTQLGRFRAEIHRQGLDRTTTIILSAKHGQSPTHPQALRRVDDGAILDMLNAAWAAAHPGTPALVTFSVDDDGMLLWLSDQRPAAEAFAERYLLRHAAPANRISDPAGVYSTTVAASGLTAVYTGLAADRFLGAPHDDARAPDLIGLAQYGVVYTGGVSKIAEHGGNHADDRDVPLIISGARVPSHLVDAAAVTTQQIAPSILTLLGLDPRALQAVRTEHTTPLPHL
jgi:hypothetical protein